MSIFGTTQNAHGLQCEPNCTATIEGRQLSVDVHLREGLAPRSVQEYTISHANLRERNAHAVRASDVAGLRRVPGGSFGSEDYVIVIPRVAVVMADAEPTAVAPSRDSWQRAIRRAEICSRRGAYRPEVNPED